MPLTGKFLADFSSFQQAVSTAELSLKSFDTNAAKVGGTLNRMADSFSGRKVIQDASLMERAIGGVEGASKLTAAEQRRVNATITEALAKYKALGQEAPAELVKLSAELNKQTVSFSQMATAAAAISGIVAGVAAGVGKLGARGADINDVRNHFDEMNKSIGVSADLMLGKLRAATLGNITDFELMKTVNLGMSQGLKLTADQMGSLGDVAAVLADRTGVDVATAFDTLTRSMATGQDRFLKHIGLNIDAKAATEAYADSIGVKVAALTEDQKKTAIQNAILEEGQRIIGQSGKAQEDFADKVGQSTAKLTNFVDRVSAWVATSPSVGAWTSTITAASSTVTAFGLAIGPISTGVAKLMPLLGLSGLGGAFASLGTVITATVIPALGTAFALLTPFLLPLAAVATAVGAVYLAWRNWDTIVPFVKGVYDGVKTWIGDKLTAIFDSVKARIDTVTGAFKSMYDKVVGHSYVPDLIAGIGVEFAKLPALMVDPVTGSVGSVEELFGRLKANVGNIFSGMMQDVSGKLNGIVQGFLPKWGEGMSGGMGKIAKASTGLLSNLMSAGVSAAVDIAGQLVMKGLAAIGSKIASWVGGGEEGTKVNPARDAWFGGRSVQDIGNQLSPFMDGESARKLIEAVFKSTTMKQFQAATGAIDKLIGSNSFAQGTQGKYLDFGAGTLAMLHGKEKITPQGVGESSRPIHVHVMLEGREIAWALVPHLPDAQAALA